MGIRFTWHPQAQAVARVPVRGRGRAGRLYARPHWGKLFTADASHIATLYERLPDFVRLTERLDPRNAFRNAWLRSKVLGDA